MYDIAEMLIDNGGNVEAVGDLQNRPLHLAAAADKLDLVGLLLSKGASISYRNVYGNTPLQVAVGLRVKNWIQRVKDGGEPERERLATVSG